MVQGKRRSEEFCRKRERIQTSRDRRSAEGSENSVVLARDGEYFFAFYFYFCALGGV